MILINADRSMQLLDFERLDIAGAATARGFSRVWGFDLALGFAFGVLLEAS